MFNRPIAPSLSPNTERDDVLIALHMLFKPWKWKEGTAAGQIEEWFRNYFSSKIAITFNSGRSAFFAILRAFDIGAGDEVIIQAFTCVAVPDPILWVGAIPVYVDIDDTLNIDSKLIEKAITDKTKAIVVQHTFGVPANMELITKITHKYRLLLIEDCCHALGATYQNKKVGTFGDASFFSFGRDKVISSVFGGAAIISSTLNQNKYGSGLPRTVLRSGAGAKLKELHEKLAYPSYYWIVQQLFHPIAFAVILPLYKLWVGKALLFILQRIKLLSKPVDGCELIGKKPSVYPARYPNALAQLLLYQLMKLERYNSYRKRITAHYMAKLKDVPGLLIPKSTVGAIYLRLNVLITNAETIFQNAKQKGLLLGNWYKHTIDPKGVSNDVIGYKKGSCPKAEKAATMSVNLPTYPSMRIQEADTVIKLITEVPQ